MIIHFKLFQQTIFFTSTSLPGYPPRLSGWRAGFLLAGCTGLVAGFVCAGLVAGLVEGCGDGRVDGLFDGGVDGLVDGGDGRGLTGLLGVVGLTSGRLLFPGLVEGRVPLLLLLGLVPELFPGLVLFPGLDGLNEGRVTLSLVATAGLLWYTLSRVTAGRTAGLAFQFAGRFVVTLG